MQALVWASIIVFTLLMVRVPVITPIKCNTGQQSRSSQHMLTNCQDQNLTYKSFLSLRVRWFPMKVEEIGQEKMRIIAGILNETVLYFGRMLFVRRNAVPIGLPSQGSCRGAGYVYPDHLVVSSGPCDPNATGGIHNADLIFYVTATSGNEHCEGGALAWAETCMYSNLDDRPVGGVIVLCAENIKTQRWNWLSLQSLLTHEMLHTTGVSRSMMDRITFQENGKSIEAIHRVDYAWKINSRYNMTHKATVIVTPKVKAFVRYYFNCSDLEGAELEDEGELGTSGTHWEKRIFGPEMMTGYVSRRTYMSGLTLSFLEDTGWYKANYTVASSQFSHGRSEGCLFAKGSCREYMDSKREKEEAAMPFCNWADYLEKKSHGWRVRVCVGFTHFASCDWKEIDPRKENSIDQNTQYFLDKWAIINGENVTGEYVKGGAAWSNGCPMWSEGYWGETDRKRRVGDSICDNEFSQPPAQANWGAELYGSNSVCLKHDGKFEVFRCFPLGLTSYHTESAHGAGCYKYKCEDGRVKILANSSGQPGDRWNVYKTCWGEGNIIKIRRFQNSGPDYKTRFHKGRIVCLSCKKLCERKSKVDGGQFKCAQDIKNLTSMDYSDVPCPMGVSNATCRIWLLFMPLLVLLLI